MDSEKIAKDIIGKWGYEEQYWWKPIFEALDLAYNEGMEYERERLLNQPANQHDQEVRENYRRELREKIEKEMDKWATFNEKDGIPKDTTFEGVCKVMGYIALRDFKDLLK